MSETTSTVKVHGLVCHEHVDMALVCFGSLLKFSVEPLQLVIHDDGSLTAEDTEKLRGLDGLTIISRSEADELMNPLLKNHPHCYKIRYEHPMFLKLLDTALLSQGDIAYCDSDILFLRPFEGMFRWPNAETSALFMRDYLEAYSVFPWHLIGVGKLKLPSKVNAGLMFVRKSAYDLDFVEWFLSKKEFRSKPVHKMEQTCWAALAYRIGCRLWNPQQVVLMRPDTALSDELVAGHFVKEIRYRLSQFIPEAERNAPKDKTVTVDTIPSQDCDILALGRNHIIRQSNRVRSYQRKIPDMIRRKFSVSS
ncbi:MAG: hypothetical protein KME08_09095 [Aphanothece sp. CMT-3BRIN-NPC111]|jgi:hypothetical protein|nr:hypothetical protein [Aphanothece sp. CMT-3BRIN-NPC111]